MLFHQCKALTCLTGEEALHLLLVLRGEYGAGGIDQATSFLDKQTVLSKQLCLCLSYLLQELRGELPLGIWVAAQYAQARTRSIDKHPIESASLALKVLSLYQACFYIVSSIALCPAREFVELLWVDIHSYDLTLAPHQRCQVKGLSPCPSTAIGYLQAAL